MLKQFEAKLHALLASGRVDEVLPGHADAIKVNSTQQSG
jgi:hypothetical protein